MQNRHMHNSSEKQWFDADEIASMLKTYRRCRARLGHVDPNQLALSVMRYFRNGITDEEIIFSNLTQFCERQTKSGDCIAMPQAPFGSARWNA